MARFEFDKGFDRKLSHNRKNSLSPLGDKVREVADDIADSAKRSIEAEASQAESVVLAIKNGSLDNNAGRRGQGYLRAKAKAFALRSAANTTTATMHHDGKAIAGRVTIHRAGSVTLEYGGRDPVARLGNTSQYVEHPAYAFLRRAMRRGI